MRHRGRQGWRSDTDGRGREPRVTGRPALSVEGYAALKVLLWFRAEGRCEYCGIVAEQALLDPEHVQARSAGGPDSWANIAVLCRRHHRMTESAFIHGRLLVDPLGDGRFRFRLVRADDKVAFARGRFELLAPEKIGGRAATGDELTLLEVLA